jgi:hypothetical protein
MQPLPEVCPTCGGSKLVRILWGYAMLLRDEEQALGQGRALLGLSYRYFRAIAQGDPAPMLILEKSRLPAWGCLDCNPRWIDLHHLTLKQWEADAAKVAAVDAGDFERAAVLLHSQEAIEEGQGADLLHLLRELVGVEATENRS